jgi:3-hydroxyacyl-CoA dehydrogenase
MDMRIDKAVVIGAGVMGHGLCQLFAQKGINVSLVDISDEILKQAKGLITSNLNFMVTLGELEKDHVEQVLSRIEFSTDLAGNLAGAKYVLEAVSENFAIKQKIWKVLSDHSDPSAILASNTSSYDIDDLAKNVASPERVIGTHWFHPPPITPCVEVIPCKEAAQANIDWTMEFLTWLGKVPTLCKSAPGFVANRIQFAMAREAISLVEEGLATPAEVDRIVKTSFGFRLSAYGPFEIMDQAGVDTYYSVFEYLYSKLSHEHFNPPELLKRQIDAGRLGLKSSRGFYDYQAGAADFVRRDRDRKLYKQLELVKKDWENK